MNKVWLRKLGGCCKTLGHLRETPNILGLLPGKTSESSWHFCWSWVLSEQSVGHPHRADLMSPPPDGLPVWHWDSAMLLVGVQ